jgi:chromosome segregation ATPase
MAIQQNANNAQLVANSDKAVTTSQSSEALGIEVSLLKEDLKKKDTGLREMHDSIESLKKAVLGTSAQTGQIKHLADAVELIRKDLKENNVSLTDAQTSQVKDLVVITRSISNQLSDIHTEQAHQRNQLSGIHTEQAHQRNHGKQLSDNIKQNKSMFFQEINSVKAKFSDMDQLRDRLGRFEKSLDTVISVPEQLSSLHRSAQSLEESKNALKTDYKTLQAKMTEVDYCGSRIGHVEKFQGQMNEMLAKSQDRIGAVEKTVQANSIAIQDVKDSGDASGQRLDEVLGATAQSLEKLLGATQDLKKRVKAVESDRSTGNGVADAEDIKQRITALETDIHAIKQQSAETPKAVKPKDEDEDDETSARLESVEGTLEVLRGQLPVWMKDIKDDITFSVNQKIKEIESKLEQSDVSTRMQNVEHRVLFLDVEAQGMKLNVNSLLTKVHALSTKAVEIENRGTQIENRNQEMINALQKDLQNVGGFTARIEMLERKAPPPPAVLAAQIGDDVCMRVKQQIKQEITRELQPRFQEIYNTRETDMFVVRNLEERYQNITTEAIYKQMVHWIQRTYPQAPDFLARLNALQNELHQERAKVRAMIQQEQLERTNANNEVRGHSDASVARIEKGLENMQAVHTNSQRELRTEFMGLVGRVSTAETRVTQVQQDVTKVQQDVKTFEAGLRKAIGDESRDRLAADTQLTSRTDGIQFKVNNLVDDSEDLVQKLKALESDTKEIVGYKGDIKTACGRLPFLEAWLGKLQAVIKALNDNSSHPLEDIEFNASKR